MDGEETTTIAISYLYHQPDPTKKKSWSSEGQPHFQFDDKS